MLGVYIHLPFCERKCQYCAFSSFVSSKEERERYIQSLIQEINTFCKENQQEKYRNVDTIFIGGGTPSLLELDLFEKIVYSLNENFDIEENIEFTIECNPNSLTEEKLKFYKKCGVNRLSLGVQTLNNDQLQTIGRLHDKDGAIRAIQQSLKYFDNVSVDLLIGLRGMQSEDYLKNLKTIVDLGVKHVSTYMLQVEKETPLYDKVAKDSEFLPSDEDCIDVYNKTVSFLNKNGFCQYEVSNFAKEGYECKHNVKYWTGKEYIGFGLSAHSYINGVRFANAKGFSDYYKRKIVLNEKLTTEQLIEEHIMLGLRCNKGVDKRYLLGLDYDIEKNENLSSFIERGIIIENQEKACLYLNPEYYGVNNYIIVHLLP